MSEPTQRLRPSHGPPADASVSLEAQIALHAVRRLWSDRELTPPPIGEESVRWEWFYRFVSFHGLASLVWYGIGDQMRSQFPSWLQEALIQDSIGSAARHRLMIKAAAEAISVLEQGGIPAISIKGPSIAAEYPAWPMRPFCDIDLLTPHETFASARAALTSAGYLPTEEIRRRPWPYVLYPHAEVLRHPESGVSIDLHWRVGSGELTAVGLDTAELVRSARIIHCAGVALPAPSLEDQVLIAASHGVRHGWQRMLQVCDLVALVSKLPPGGVDAALRRAQSMGKAAERTMEQGLSLSATVIGESWHGGRPDRAKPLANWLLRRMNSCSTATLSKDVTVLAVIPNSADRLRYAWFAGCKRVFDYIDNHCN